MRFRTIALSALLTAIAVTAQAHTHLERSTPADKSRVKAPAAIELHFSEAAKLTALALKKGTDAAQPIKPLPTGMLADFSIPVPALAAGDYVVSWRVLSDDGHVMSGKFGFTVDPAAPAAASMAPAHKGKAAGTEDEHGH